MDMMQDPAGEIILTIAIPTYNGAGTLQETLDSVVTQLQPNVDILISDNASTDGTAEIVRKYQAGYPHIRYHRNSENVGADQNFNLAVQQAKGKYVWLLSDDDVLEPTAIQVVVSVIKSHSQLATIFVNWSNWGHDLGTQLRPATLQLNGDILCEEHNAFISIVKLNALFVSSLIVNRNLWCKANPELNIGTNWAHYATMLRMAVNKPSYCVAAPLVRFRSGLFGWKSNYLARLNNTLSLNGILNTLPKYGYRESLARELVNIAISDLPMIIVGCKQQTSLSWNHCYLLLRTFGLYPRFIFTGLPMLLIPGFVFRMIGQKLMKRIFFIAGKCRRYCVSTFNFLG